ncbi:NUDIX domain-containing protein [Natronosporangium hydrolyticum]|uniref:NUDIX domain-containing protein n=1 Tax=Natronosporangium hydrolyticum TaxID=2811111 RepID=A0A895YHU5_9ACTN|nr:NUDIX domain-containing protein [Natronosporangium hydrolyticum]QSB15605.1 NUDIX domain-containing protein [Natronosporangium hydrolyticum]
MRRRIGAYGVCRDPAGRLLLVRAGAQSARRGQWLLPGGGLEHGEHPAEAVLRELTEETGLTGRVVGLRDVLAEVVERRSGREHTDGVIFDLELPGVGPPQPEPGDGVDELAWLSPAAAATLPHSGFVAAVIAGDPGPTAASWPVAESPAKAPEPVRGRPRGQRFAVYGLVTEAAGRVLLTRTAAGYPGAGRWHLPGGGNDAGEQPRAALAREVAEETAQQGEIGRLLTVSHHRDPAAFGPEGHPVDWHAVRAVFQVSVPAPTPPRVLELAGSTAAAAWFTWSEAMALPLTEVARGVLTTRWSSGQVVA